MKLATIAIASTLVLGSTLALAQNAGSGSSKPSGDAAVSPATGNPPTGSASGSDHPTLGTGINSGAMDNGTTGDTIGTGHGTPAAPAAPAAAKPPGSS